MSYNTATRKVEARHSGGCPRARRGVAAAWALGIGRTLSAKQVAELRRPMLAWRPENLKDPGLRS